MAEVVTLTCRHCAGANERPLPFDMTVPQVCDHCHRLMTPIPTILTCPSCNARHIVEGPFAVKHHHTHACQTCGLVWRPAKEFTVGVQFLPGYKS